MFFLIDNCAVVNNNICQTAETVPKGRFRVGGGFGTGVDAWFNGDMTHSDRFKDSSLTVQTLHSSDDFSSFLINNYFNFFADAGYGVADKLEVNAKLWLSVGLQNIPGIRAGVKLGFLDSTSALRMAIMPGILYGMYQQIYDFDASWDASKDYYADVHLVGIDIPFVVSYKIIDKLQIYLAPSYSCYYMFTSKRETGYPPYSMYLNNTALHIGLSGKFHRFFVRPEYGLSFQFGTNGHTVLSNTFGMGWGFEY
jgi:hypothetical protein